MVTMTEIHTVYVPHGMSAELVWEHIKRGEDVPTDPRESDDPNTPTRYGCWVNLLVIDGQYRGEI